MEIDVRYLFARNNMHRDLGSLFSEDLSVISVDNMSKVKIGVAAVLRYHPLKHIFPTNDQPNFVDHDFLVSGYFLKVSGHMVLYSREENNRNIRNDECEGLVSASSMTM